MKKIAAIIGLMLVFAGCAKTDSGEFPRQAVIDANISVGKSYDMSGDVVRAFLGETDSFMIQRSSSHYTILEDAAVEVTRYSLRYKGEDRTMQAIVVIKDDFAYLSGLLEEEKEIVDFDALYEYMKADTRFVMLPYPESKLSPGVSEIDLAIEGNEKYRRVNKEEGKFHMSGDNYIVEEDSNLYLVNEISGEKELLIEGNDVEEHAEAEKAVFLGKIDDNRFLYKVIGWEWVVRTGVYDISTLKERVLGEDLHFELAGNKYLLAMEWEYGADSGRYVKIVDLADYSSREIDIPAAGSAASPDGTEFAVISSDKNTGEWKKVTVNTYSLPEGTPKGSYTIETAKCLPYALQYCDGKLVVNCSPLPLFDEYAYVIEEGN